MNAAFRSKKHVKISTKLPYAGQNQQQRKPNQIRSYKENE